MTNVFQKETEILKHVTTSFKNEGYEKAFKDNPSFTSFISDVVDKLSKKMGLLHYREYYTLDHVLYSQEDRIPEGELPFGTSSVRGTWLKHIRVAIEHENGLDSAGGYQEFAKLMLFSADVKVLMGYGNRGDNYDDYAKDYYEIFNSVHSNSTSTPILFIGEYGDGHVDAYLITKDGLLKYHSENESWASLG